MTALTVQLTAFKLILTHFHKWQSKTDTKQIKICQIIPGLIGLPWLLQLLMTADVFNKDKRVSLFFQPNSEASGAAI